MEKKKNFLILQLSGVRQNTWRVKFKKVGWFFGENTKTILCSVHTAVTTFYIALSQVLYKHCLTTIQVWDVYNIITSHQVLQFFQI